jgi:hypothetical protein
MYFSIVARVTILLACEENTRILLSINIPSNSDVIVANYLSCG